MDMDRAYANGAFIPNSEAYLPRWQADAEAFRSSLGARAELNLPYGPGARQKVDLFHPEGPAKGLLVFLHGGYWMATGREVWSHLAAGAVARGWACALPSYTLAPEARIAAMTQEAAQAVAATSARLPGLPVVVAGHSAGGHLSARMGCADLDLPMVRRVVPISPLSDLEPLMQTAMNTTLRLDADEAAVESPAHLPRRAGVDAHVWVGGQERPAFLWQARLLSENWDCGWTVAPGRHHFDVLDALTDPHSALCEACLGDLPG
ncbi:alpha/beta hydrolase [Gemmobacter fulvus]|uniref:Alpha/beta hydrolase n=1 Tax=Gemmobacter fulvus TaxID=2840474 RepID=A0A975PAA2_9RHOB|nr:alpha/beta hydrolase [Gemmobacter fulvus]MBT9244507.1 alpha/beta hydrolase [Gemmobacter fulvus]QWK91376.1 alpha/beta hydrolase [Gemmobacter fulvus]